MIVEVKQESNHESRREVVAQLLEYAALLKGIDIDSLEREPLHSFLTNSGYESIFEAVTETYPGFTPDAESFHATMQEHLDRGDFRLVLALDEAPPGLQRIVAYLDAITIDVVTLDLVTIRPYVIDGTRVILSERIGPVLRGACAPSGADRIPCEQCSDRGCQSLQTLDIRSVRRGQRRVRSAYRMGRGTGRAARTFIFSQAWAFIIRLYCHMSPGETRD